MRELRVRRGRDEAVDCGRRKFAMARKGSTISRVGAQLGRAGQTEGSSTGKSRMSFSAANHELVRVREEEDREGCYSVRINVFHHEQGFPLEAEIDELRMCLILAPPAASHRGQGVIVLISAPSLD
jgi:hypothetical protein